MGAHLLRIRDAEGKPLPDARVLPHLGMLFFADKKPHWLLVGSVLHHVSSTVCNAVHTK